MFIILVLVSGGMYAYFQKKNATKPGVSGPVLEMRLLPRQEMKKEQAALVAEPELVAGVKQAIATRADVLKSFVSDGAIIESVRTANEKNKTLSLNQITALDQEWIATKAGAPFSEQFVTNETAKRLISFQNENTAFKEIFIADANGLIVGETDKTSDYYQADESWWVNTMDGGRGKVVNGAIEFDDSAQTQAISIYVPVMDPDSRQAIGVIKGVLDLGAIEKEL